MPPDPAFTVLTKETPYAESFENLAYSKVLFDSSTPSQSRATFIFSGMNGCKRIAPMRRDSALTKMTSLVFRRDTSSVFLARSQTFDSWKNLFVCLEVSPVRDLEAVSYLQSTLHNDLSSFAWVGPIHCILSSRCYPIDDFDMSTGL